MKNQKIIFKLIVSCAIVTALLSLLIISCFLKPINVSNTFTVYSDDDYYSETTYFKDEDEFYKRTSANNQKNSVKALNQTSDKKFVAGIEKKVWVGETYGNNGQTINSRLLKKSEVESLSCLEEQENLNSSMVQSSATHSFGGDKESYYALSIMLTADYYASTDYYKVSAFSTWDSKYSSEDTKQMPEMDYEDYAGFTWGGEGTLQGSSYKMSGEYVDYSTLNAARSLTNSYAGVVWQFIEKSNNGSPLRTASSYMHIIKVGEMLNKVTSVRFTYIHTYDVVRGSVSITINSNGTIAGGLTLSNAEKQWQIEVDLTGFEY